MIFQAIGIAAVACFALAMALLFASWVRAPRSAPARFSELVDHTLGGDLDEFEGEVLVFPGSWEHPPERTTLRVVGENVVPIRSTWNGDAA